MKAIDRFGDTSRQTRPYRRYREAHRPRQGILVGRGTDVIPARGQLAKAV